jgi:hypothetical protein
LVGALGRPGEVGAPLGGDDPLLLERTQDAVEVADVHTDVLPRHLRHALDELVAVHGPLAQEEQERRLDEALDARPDGPVAVPQRVPRAGPTPMPVATSHSHLQVKHI